MPTLKSPTSIAVAIFFLVSLVFCGASTHEFLAWDDGNSIYRNETLNPVTATSFRGMWEHQSQNTYRPVLGTLVAALAIAARLPEPRHMSYDTTMLDPMVFHVANIVLHGLNAVLVFLLLLLVFEPPASDATPESRRNFLGAAAFGALVFGLHPVQIEPVAWATGITDLLKGTFALLILWHWALMVQARQRHDTAAARLHAVYASVAFGLGLLAHPAIIVVPLVALVLDLWWLEPGTGKAEPGLNSRDLWNRYWLLGLWGALSLPMVWRTGHGESLSGLGGKVSPLWMRPAIAGDALLFYIGKLLMPLRLGPDYGRPPEWVLAHAPLVIAGFAAFAAIVIGLGMSEARQRHHLAGAALLFLCALLPNLGLVSFQFQNFSTVANRYLYLPMLGVALGLGYLAMKYWSKRLKFVCVAVLLLLSIDSALQNRYWANSRRFAEHALEVNPQSALGHHMLGLVLADNGDVRAAVPEFREAVSLKPNYSSAHSGLGLAYLQLGNHQGALDELSTAANLNPSDAETQNNLGAELARQHRLNEAFAHYKMAVDADPDYAMGQLNLGHFLMVRGNFPEAIDHLMRAAQLAPDRPDALILLGACCDRMGNNAAAIGYYQMALQRNPRIAPLHRALAEVLLRSGHGPEAVAQLQTVVALNPGDNEARARLRSLGAPTNGVS